MFSTRAELLEKNPPREGERVISTLKPYPAYKDSGLPWLGQVPEHWEVKRGKALFRCIDIRSQTGEEDLLTVSSERGVVPRRSANVTMFKAESYIGYKLCWPDDLVINSLWAWARGLGVSPYHGIVSSAYGVYRLRNTQENNPRFIHQLVRSVPFQWELQVRSKGIWLSRLQLTDDAFLAAPFPMPPLPEQAAIVRFLEYMDRRIRRVVHARQRQIKLLEEYRQALIHQAVTGQMDVRTGEPYAAYKESGVPWLGQVPEHWEVVPNRSLLKKRKKLVGSRHPEYQLLSLTKQGIIVRDLTVLKGKFSADLGTSQEVRPGDLVFCLFDIAETPRTVGLSPYLGMITGAYTIFEPLGKCRGEFIERFYIAMDDRKLLAPMYSGLRNTIPPSAFLQTKTPVPPLSEQTAIVEYLDAQTAKIEAAIAALRRENDLLREYRERLIAGVVTGKVDVREVAARLPEEPSEEDAPWTDEEESAQDEALNGEGDHAAISEEDG
jgi:type I restriction enzyme S subunit